MNRQAADRTSAVVIALWALVLLPGLRGGVRVMNANDLLTPVSNLAGMAIVAVIVVAAGYGVAVITGLLLGRDQARLMALGVGGVSTVAGVFLIATGLVPALFRDRTGAAVVALTCAGGPLLVGLAVVGGLQLPSFPRRSRPQLRRPVPVDATPDTGVEPTSTPLPASDPTHDYWVRGVAQPEQAAPPEPFWSDLSAAGWVGFVGLAGTVLLGALWIGTRWHHGDHPLAGLALVGSAIGIARLWDARRRRRA